MSEKRDRLDPPLAALSLSAPLGNLIALQWGGGAPFGNHYSNPVREEKKYLLHKDKENSQRLYHKTSKWKHLENSLHSLVHPGT